MTFKGTEVFIINDDGVILSGFVDGNLLVRSKSECAGNILLTKASESESIKWHNRLGHIG